MKNSISKYILILCISLAAFTPLSGQDLLSFGQTSNTEDTNIITGDRNTMLARSSADYRVTPGDVYTLAYAAGSTAVSYIITVDNTYRIRVSNLGVVNGAGKTFMQVKSEIEAIVTNNFPLSGVQLVLTQPALFKVYVKGEVASAAEMSAWALDRLSVLAGDNLTAYTSLRDVQIRSSNGQTRTYDLFKAQREGDLSQNPYLRPGDEITFSRIKRQASISGAVERPGTYQLLDGENILELINNYGSGFTTAADRTRIEVARVVNSADKAGDRLFLSTDDLSNNFNLEIDDHVIVPSISDLQPVMFVEGAIQTTAEGSVLAPANRLPVRFLIGDTYDSLVRRNAIWFSEISDIQNAYIIRNNERLPLNLNLALYDSSYEGGMLIQENDILMIPFKQYFVLVTGAVVAPGRFPYIPDRDWEYYISLAGGFAHARNAMNSVKIVDSNGKQLKKTDIIPPETTITAAHNHFLYNFNLYAPVISTVLGIITSVFSVLTLFNLVN